MNHAVDMFEGPQLVTMIPRLRIMVARPGSSMDLMLDKLGEDGSFYQHLRVVVASIDGRSHLVPDVFLSEPWREDVGWAVLCAPGTWKYELMVNVIASFRRQGIGSSLVRVALAESEIQPKVFRTGNERLERFWASFGDRVAPAKFAFYAVTEENVSSLCADLSRRGALRPHEVCGHAHDTRDAARAAHSGYAARGQSLYKFCFDGNAFSAERIGEMRSGKNVMAHRKKQLPLTEEEWRRVFRARCQSKQGQRVSDEDRALLDRAFNTDEERYAAMTGDVFDATVPFGSSARWKR